MADFSPLQKIFAREGAERPQAGSRFGVSWALLIALSLVLVCAVAWAFFMGYMVGKGENPGESLGALAGMSHEEEAAPAQIFVEPEAREANAALKPEPIPDNILAPPAGASAMAWPQTAPGPAPARAQPAKAAPVAKAAAPPGQAAGEKHDYTFQVAALRTAEEAEKVRKTLGGMKMRATRQKSGKVHLVLVNLRGTAADVAQFKQKLKSAHLGNPLQLSRKPVETAKKTGSRR